MHAAIVASGLCLIGAAGLTSGGSVQSDAEIASISRGQNQRSRTPQSLMRGPFAVPAANDDRLRPKHCGLELERTAQDGTTMAQDPEQNPEQDGEDFECPQCQARYKIVRVKAGPQTIDRPVQCKVCAQPFVSKDGEDILKYFLIDRPKTGGPRIH
jgi:predicted Zn finger-like uncharacterized protein